MAWECTAKANPCAGVDIKVDLIWLVEEMKTDPPWAPLSRNLILVHVGSAAYIYFVKRRRRALRVDKRWTEDTSKSFFLSWKREGRKDGKWRYCICVQKRSVVVVGWEGVVTVRVRYARLLSPWYIMRSNVVMISRLPGHPYVKYARAHENSCVCVCMHVGVWVCACYTKQKLHEGWLCRQRYIILSCIRRRRRRWRRRWWWRWCSKRSSSS